VSGRLLKVLKQVIKALRNFPGKVLRAFSIEGLLALGSGCLLFLPLEKELLAKSFMHQVVLSRGLQEASLSSFSGFFWISMAVVFILSRSSSSFSKS
jgi:hypothetical protein